MFHHSQFPLFERFLWQQIWPCVFHATIYSMFNLEKQFGGHYSLPLRSRYNLPYIILHDGLQLLHHGILPNLVYGYFFIHGRFKFNDVTQCYINYLCLGLFRLTAIYVGTSTSSTRSIGSVDSFFSSKSLLRR